MFSPNLSNPFTKYSHRPSPPIRFEICASLTDILNLHGIKMSKPRATYLYTETRLNLDPAYSGSTVELDLSESENLSLPKRKVLTGVQPSISEATFSKHHLANDSSIYFRRESRY